MNGEAGHERVDAPALAVVRAEIEARGPISFARFMELALYAPGVGYYEQPGRMIGRKGDFYTSVSVGPVFGFLLAMGWADRLAEFEQPMWVEAAAHDGRLARDVLEALDRFRPELATRVRYRIVEPSPVRRAVQRGNLGGFAARVDWVTALGELGDGLTGLIVSNELLDAFPVERFAWEVATGKWSELGVTIRDGRLAECRLPAGRPWSVEIAAGLEPLLPDGFVVERCPGAEAWWKRAAGTLARGALVAFDYGHGEGDVIRPERRCGTARAYRNHRVSDDLLASPGGQDLTAHVDFPRLITVGEELGLRTDAFLPQGRWLGRVAAGVFAGEPAGAAWLTERTRQFQTLTHPGHLGAALKVLAQSR